MVDDNAIQPSKIFFYQIQFQNRPDKALCTCTALIAPIIVARPSITVRFTMTSAVSVSSVFLLAWWWYWALVTRWNTVTIRMTPPTMLTYTLFEATIIMIITESCFTIIFVTIARMDVLIACSPVFTRRAHHIKANTFIDTFTFRSVQISFDKKAKTSKMPTVLRIFEKF